MTDLIERLRSALDDRYAVERQLGAGGMAIVFLARDEKHNRSVAIKVLRPELTASIGGDRFLREIEIAARLQHPHILPLYDSGSADGLLYYVMPFVEGESLGDRLRREGRLNLKDAYRISGEVASALDYAHRQGIVHRDIKPENILLSEGHAVVADFGIARALTVAGGEGVTQAGIAVGTPSYMSPEQAAGSSAEIDGRSDIYSLGCVLYQMLTGHVPFRGASPQEILAKTLTAEIPRVTAVRAEVPVGVEESLVRALAKHPGDRFATAAEFATALEERAAAADRHPWWQRYAIHAAAAVLLVALVFTWWFRPPTLDSAVASDAQVIAVLPFSTSGPNVDLLGEGMVDLMSTNLNGVGGIRTVDPRTVLHRWRRRADEGGVDFEGSLAVGRDADAASVLMGSVVSAGPEVRLSAELFAVSGTELARVSAEGPADSVFALVDSLSLRLMREIWRSNEPVPDFRVSGLTTGSLDAIRAYLRGEQFYRRSQWDSAIAGFARAVAADSAFALAHHKLSLAYGWTEGHASPNASEASAEAAAHADRLPGREQLMVAGSRLFEQGRLAALDSMQLYVQQYPDDAEGWNLFADIRYHAQPILAFTPEELVTPFDTVLALDPTFTPALIHPLELSVLFGDSARFRRYLRALEESPNAPEMRPFRTLGEARWGDEALTVGRVVGVLEQDGWVWFGPFAAAALISQVVPMDTVLAAMDAFRARLPAGDPGWYALTLQRTGLRLATGRLQAAASHVDSLWEINAGAAAYQSLAAAVFGYPGWPHAKRGLEFIEKEEPTQPDFAFIRGAFALSQGDPATARRVIGAVDTASTPVGQRALLQGVAAWARLVEGDTTAAIRDLRAAIRRAGYQPAIAIQGGLLRYQLAAALAARPETREEAIRRLRYDWFMRGAAPFALITLAEAQEAEGDRDGAAFSYAQFVRLWEDADPELQPLVDDVRQALRRLTGEPTAG